MQVGLRFNVEEGCTPHEFTTEFNLVIMMRVVLTTPPQKQRCLCGGVVSATLIRL